MRTISELKRDTRQQIKEKILKILLCMLGYIVLSYVIEYLLLELSGYFTMGEGYSEALLEAAASEETLMAFMEDPLKYIPEPVITPAAAVLMAVLALFYLILDAGLEKLALDASRKVPFGFKTLLDAFNFPIKVLIIQLFRTALMVAGLLCFVVPGLVFHYQYRFALMILYDDPKKGAFRCLMESHRLTRGRKIDLFVLDMTFIGWMLLSSLISMFFFPVLDLWLTPYRKMTFAAHYNDLIGHRTQKAEETINPEENDHE